MKKTIIIVLILGAIIALGLGVVLSSKSKELKNELQSALNTHAEKFAKSLESEGAKLTYAPFECSGLINVGCFSKEVSLQAQDDESLQLVLHDVGLEISPSSLSQDTLKASLKLKNIEIQNLDTQNQQLSQEIAEIAPFIPEDVSCDVGFHHDKDTLTESYSCRLNAPNASYESKASGTYKDESFSSQNIAQILQSYYAKLFETPTADIESLSNAYPKLQYALGDFSLSLKDKGISKDLYALYEKNAKLTGAKADKEGFEQVVNTGKGAFIFGSMMAFGNLYKQEIATLGDNLANLVLGKKSEVSLRFAQKDKANPYFFPVSELGDPRATSELFTHYTLEVQAK